ncbi:MAG: diphthine--ammonia ligase [archaeon]|nr:diphthine--ammonia ligase [archaeon]
MASIQGAKALVLSSGGKDSILALHKAWELGLRIIGIVTMLPEDPESMLYHTHNVRHAKSIAESIGINWYGFEAKKKEEEKALEKALKKLNADFLISGGIASNYQKNIFDKIAESANMKHLAPLWGIRPYDILNEIISMKMDVIIISVAAYGLDENWLGRHLTKESVDELLKLSEKYHFNPVGEGGDFDSFVLNAPLYKKRLIPIRVIKRWEKDSGALEIQELMMEDKDFLAS